MDKTIYYDKKTLEPLKKEFAAVSPSTWHKIMNPYCGECLAERGKAFVEGNTKKG